MSLPNDAARCAGSGNDVEGWREGCDICQRRTDRTAHAQSVRWMTPPAIIAFECEWLIEAGERT